ncbi:MAG TPA: TolC family protein [Sediminibacterium sp.]|nr:TolC family protein [Sediminibacterium sp.]
MNMYLRSHLNKARLKWLLSAMLLLGWAGMPAAHAQENGLEYYLQAGIANSPLLKDIQQQQALHVIDSLRLLANYGIQVNGISTNNYAPVIKGWGYDGAITNGLNFSQLVVASRQLIRKADLQNQEAAIGLLNTSLQISGKISEQDLVKSVTAQYITAYGIWQQLDFHNDLLNLLKKEELLLKRLTEKGVYRQTDYLSFLVNMQQEELAISQIKQQYQNEFAALNFLCGIQDTAAVKLRKPDLHLSVVPLPQQTIFYRKYENDSLQLVNSHTQIDFQYRPKVNVYADGGFLSSFAEKAYKNFGTSVGLNLSIPIYDGHQKKMQHDQLKIAEITRQGYRDFFTSQYHQQVAQLLQQLHATDLLLQQTDKQIQYTETLIEANRKLLETGDARMPDYILAISNYLAAHNLVTQTTINRLQLINQINYWNKN